MNWLKKAISLTTVSSDRYYTLVDPAMFYEWKFLGHIPKDTIFTKRLPPTEKFTDGFIIASAKLSPISFSQEKNTYKIVFNTPVSARIEAGPALSQKDILKKYTDLRHKHDLMLSEFKRSCQSQKYLITLIDNMNIYKISSITDLEVGIQNFGTINEFKLSVNDIVNHMFKQSRKKIGRSYELNDVTKIHAAMQYLNQDLPLDNSKLETLIKISQLQPKSTFQLSWDNLYKKVSFEFNSIKKILSNYESLRWIQHRLNNRQDNDTNVL